MIKYSTEWNHLNNLLSGLRSAKAVRLVHEYYLQYDNTAPGNLLEQDIARCQADLDNASSEGEGNVEG